MRAVIQAHSPACFRSVHAAVASLCTASTDGCSVDANRSVRAKSGPAPSVNAESSSKGKKRLAGTELGQSSPLTHQHHFDGVQVSNEPLQNLAKCDQGHLVSSWNTVS